MDMLTVKEVALLTRRHEETVTNALRVGSLHGGQRKKGGRWLVRRACAEAWAVGESCGHEREAVAA
jgi:hypothetical protein